ncbi:hypothetical protein ACHAXT_001446 [Thalassiosira profunda]
MPFQSKASGAQKSGGGGRRLQLRFGRLRLPFLGALSLTAAGKGGAAANYPQPSAGVHGYCSRPAARSISGIASKAAFVSLPNGKVTSKIDPPQKASTPVLGDARPMKRAAPALTSSAKRSFGVSLPSLGMSTTAKEDAPTQQSGAMNNTHALPPMVHFRNSLSHSWINHLSPEDPENRERSLSKYRRAGGHPGRPVFNGHYVSVRPTPLKNPKLVLHSPELLRELGFREDEAASAPFVKYFSGDVDGAFEGIDVAVADASDADDAGMVYEKEIETWATPYALSIMGRRYTNNCPYGTGDGYGDGRAISVGEILVPHTGKDAMTCEDDEAKEGDGYPTEASRYELQLKGAGQTPFCRGADGRAVLRSSIREFLASEAMHHLGISTTRALSLIVSDTSVDGTSGDTSTRPWYSDSAQTRELPTMDDPRLAQYDEKQRREIISQLAAQAKSDPDMLMEEKNAITTRVASSFVRIGHLDLFARRVEAFQSKEDFDPKKVKETMRYQELEDMMWHACYREYYSTAYAPFFEKKDAKGAAMALMEGAMTKNAAMVGGWIRVGFVQGNFNADNNLIGGRTMDYGPFGFLDVYHPLSAKWTGSGEHFGFMNQPNAGYANFAVLVESLLPIIDAEGGDSDVVRDEMLKKAQSVFSDAVDEAMRAKMGLVGGPEEMGKEADELWGELEPLLRIARGDWTLFWRQLTYVAETYSPAKGNADAKSKEYDGMMKLLLGEGDAYPFYDKLSDENTASLRAWMERWHKALCKCYSHASTELDARAPPEESMRLSNPKYTLREWMLVDAYTKADPGKPPGSPVSIPGDYSGIRELFELCKDPYGEGSAEMHKKYYRRAPDESLRAGGTAFMS